MFSVAEVVCVLAMNVAVHLERFHARHNLLHVGVSFHTGGNWVRYDFRPFNDGRSYVTTAEQRLHLGAIMPALTVADAYVAEYAAYRANISAASVDIVWGESDKTWPEIAKFEETCLRRRYVLGIYDCRHYVREFTRWSTGRATPVWLLHTLWQEYAP
jgi:hypothetical protein